MLVITRGNPHNRPIIESRWRVDTEPDRIKSTVRHRGKRYRKVDRPRRPRAAHDDQIIPYEMIVLWQYTWADRTAIYYKADVVSRRTRGWRKDLTLHAKPLRRYT